jgi:DegV family protein with EDD domain
MAAQAFNNVYIVDSENICTGQGYLVLRAARLAAEGLPPLSICSRLQRLAKRIELSFVLDRLDYMAKSGRCSGVLAFGANLLKIKPCLEVIDGELKVTKKYRGSLKSCVERYAHERLDGRTDIEDDMVLISSCLPQEGCVEAERDAIQSYGKFQNIYETEIGSTIGGHSGPGTIGIVFARKE